MKTKNWKRALTFSVSGALLLGVVTLGCEKPIKTSNPGPEMTPVNVPEAPEAEKPKDEVEQPVIIKTNPGPVAKPKPEAEPEEKKPQ